MVFDWKEYFSLAEELSQRSDEAARRSAISRAYYSAFNVARAHAESQGWPIQTSRDSHKVVWDAFRSKGFGAVHLNGSRLRDKRRQADYEDNISRLPDLMDTALEEARKVFYYLGTIKP
ncbi:MAG: hypothetical protein KF868_00425 [Acidobacteria bacterium]|nr:hypothetical protein [Acidobacteriota bacterium]MCW5969422.1 hypothetical protein [Blastocatellales bacterium]